MFGDHGLCGLLEEGAHGKSPKCLGGNLGDFGEFCKGLRRRMHHRPCGFGGGTGKYALAARKGGFVTSGAVGFTGIEDEGGLAVEADVFGDGLGIAQVGEEREGDGVV